MSDLLAGPPPGHPSTGEVSKIMRVPESHRIFHVGKVLQSIDSNSYTYIRVEMTYKNTWLAAPRVDLNAGQSISFPLGTTMHNFYSRKLKRTFPSVIFVESVEILPQRI